MSRVLFARRRSICRSSIPKCVMKDLVIRAELKSQYYTQSAAITEEIRNPVYPPAVCKLVEHEIDCIEKTAQQLKNSGCGAYSILTQFPSLRLLASYGIMGRRKCSGRSIGMVKAVFIDYMGTAVDEHSPEMMEIVGRFCRHSALHDPKLVQRFILDTRRRYEADSYLDGYLSEDEIVDRIISDAEKQIGLADDCSALIGLIHSHWVNAPVFPDASAFFEQCPVPVYIITNNGLSYMEQALRRNGLNAAGVVSGDTVRAYKPHREIFDEALRLSGCAAEEAVHIGDSYDTDVVGARNAGIRPVLLLRGHGRQHDDVEAVDDLTQALNLIFN